MTEEMETRIRQALRNKALEVDVPEELAERTLAAARSAEAPSLRERIRARRDARRMHGRVTGYPRLVYAAAAGAAALVLFGVGALVTGDRLDIPTMAGPEVDEGRGPVVGMEQTEGMDIESGTERFAESTVDVPIRATSQGAAAVQAGPAPDLIEPPVPGRPGGIPPRIIRTAELDIEVGRGEFRNAWRTANGIAGRHGGFVTSSATEQLEDGGRGSLTMRVPAEQLDAALGDLRRLGEVSTETTSAQDVSGQIVDLEARLRALRAEETQLLELVNQARNVPEVLEVRSRLQQVRQEIESLDGRRQFLADQVDLATIHATLFEPDAGRPVDGDNILLDAWRTALRAGLTIVAGTMVVLGGLLPLALLAGGIWGLVRLLRRRAA